MRTIGLLFWYLGVAILFPFWLVFTLIDYLFLDLPKEMIANKWRRNAKVGDRAYFYNMLGTKSVGTITHIYEDGEARLERQNSSGAHALKNLYPAKESDY